MYNVLYTGIIVIVGIAKIEAGLTALEEFRSATDEAAAVVAFCSEHSPALNVADYLGVNADGVNLTKSWGWDFSEGTPELKEIVLIVNNPMPVALNGSKDYYQFREYQRTILDTKTWANLSSEERDFMIKLYLKETALDDATDALNKVTHLISTGQAGDAESARTVLVDNWASHHILEIESCQARATSKALYNVIGKYLTLSDATDFFITVENLYLAYRDQAIKGINDGPEVGLFDYVESTPGTVYEFAGLSTSKLYVMQNGDADMTNFVIDLMNILRNGIY
ncbi:MAG: hypothetical protein COB15_09740 [Flavobacteriales bacterium]|nr:MAG: hypothetical protein COB15_09740 [Flavobacteriales bacterium]